MVMRRILLAVAVAVATLGFGPVAEAAPVTSLMRKAIPSTSTAGAPPLGFALFCLNNPGDCRAGGKARIAYSQELGRAIQRVNAEVNRQIRFRSDRSESWNVDTRRGDCEDYVLTKRRRLVNLGVSPSALRIAVVRNSRGDGHAVLVVKTDRGEFVLDNARQQIIAPQSTGYTWLAMSTENPRKWVHF